GIRPEAIRRVFDSFFTTKPPGSGTGLGLNISYSIVVNKHRGDITVESEPGRTVFRVELPRTVPV
ncbi:MAG TPA: ATP-binding protein, partial [Acidimicrobiia bacterium]